MRRNFRLDMRDRRGLRLDSSRGASAYLIILVAICGCAPSVILTPPVEWPAEWRNRKLYHTPRALIYATSDAAAGEADRLTNRISADHKIPVPAEDASKKGLIIVLDRGDAPVCESVEALMTLFVVGQAQLAGRDAPTDEQIRKFHTRMADEASDLGPMLNHLLAMIPMPIAKHDVSTALGFPQDAAPNAAWAGIFPTEALIRQESAAMTDAMIEKAATEDEIPLTARWMLKPLMPTIRNLLAGEILKLRDGACENILRQDDPVWIADRDARNAALSAWRVVKAGGSSRAAYDVAFETIHASATRLADDTEVLRALAAAQYRTDRFDDAIATLDRIRSLDKQRVQSSGAGAFADIARTLMPADAVDKAVSNASLGRPGDLAFRAMAEYRRGNESDAVTAYQQLHDLVETHYKESADAARFLFEATNLLGPLAVPTSRPAAP